MSPALAEVVSHLLAQLSFYHKLRKIFKCLVQQCSCKKQPKKSFCFEGVTCTTISVFFFYRGEGKEMEQVYICKSSNITVHHRACYAKSICPREGICKFCLICHAAAGQWNQNRLQFGCKPCWGNLFWYDTNISQWRAHTPQIICHISGIYDAKHTPVTAWDSERQRITTVCDQWGLLYKIMRGCDLEAKTHINVRYIISSLHV